MPQLLRRHFPSQHAEGLELDPVRHGDAVVLPAMVLEEVGLAVEVFPDPIHEGLLDMDRPLPAPFPFTSTGTSSRFPDFTSES